MEASEGLRQRLESVRSDYYREEVVTGGLAWAASILLLGSAAILVEYAFALPVIGRTVLALMVVLLGAGLLVRLVIVPLLKKYGLLPGLSLDETALLVGRQHPSIADHLRNLMQLARLDLPGRLYSPDLLLASLENFSETSKALDFSSVVEKGRMRRAGRAFAAVALGFVILVFSPGSDVSTAAWRLANFRSDFLPPLPFTFTVSPGSIGVIKNESVSITVRITPNPQAVFSGTLPKEITLEIRNEGVSSPEPVVLHADTSGVFTYASGALRTGFTYRAQSGEVHSETYRVSVTDRPFIRSFTMRVSAPRYARSPEQRLDENVGDVQTLAGSAIRWEIHPSKPVRSGAIVLDGGRTIPLAEREGALHAGMTLASTVGYRIVLEDESGVTNENPIHYMLSAASDAAPTVAILVPGKNLDIMESTAIPLQIRITDDYGFSSLRLAYRLIHSKYEKPQEQFTTVAVPLSSSAEKEQIAAYLWKIAPLGLVPEDVIEYHAEVTDNDAVTGPKTAVSDSYLLRLPSMEEVFAEAEHGQNDAVRTLDESLKQAEALKKEMEELDRDVKKNQASDWQKQQKAEELVKQYGDIQKKLEDVSRQMEQMTQQLQQNNLLSPETLKKYAELQQLMQQMNSPEFREALKRLQDAMKSANPDQIRQAMQNMQFSEESFRNSIERTMNLLKRIQVEQKTDELVKRAAEMQKKQEELAKETSSLSPDRKEEAEKLARKQDDLSGDLADFQKELEKLKKSMEEFGKQMPMEKMKKAEASAKSEEMERSMKQASQQLKSGQKQQAMQNQQQAGSRMQQLSQNLTEMQEQLLANQMAEAMNGLKKAMQDMLGVSQKQEQLKNQSQKLDPNSQQFRENAERQMNLQSDLSSIAGALGELSQQSFVVTPEMGKALGRAMAQMNAALNGLQERSGQQASLSQGEAMASLNQAATVVQNAMKQLQQGGNGSGGSLLQQLQRMSAQQQGINAQTQQLGEGSGEKPGGLSQEQLAQMGRLAAEQQAVQKSMEQLNREASQSPDRDKILGDLKKIADDMKEVVQSLQQHSASQETQQKQDRILSRMLNAQRSLRERDYEEQRKAVTGRTLPLGTSPAELAKQSEPLGLKRDLQRAQESGYSKEYMDLIRRYYDALQKKHP
ncbi:MAG: DUF4175 family protein [Acidobacteriota bacterium]